MSSALSLDQLLGTLPSSWCQRQEYFTAISVPSWNYADFLTFTDLATQYCLQNPEHIFLISCSHPYCLTHGSGLQKNSPQPLKDFDQQQDLPFPLYYIKRGGGLTYHYPGQLIFYPILNFTYHKKNLSTLMMRMLKTVGEVLSSHTGLKYDYKNTLLGLWYQQSKIASIGMGLNRFISQHGLALNLHHDDFFFKQLQQLHPCGINMQTYQSVEAISAIKLNWDELAQECSFALEKILHKTVR